MKLHPRLLIGLAAFLVLMPVWVNLWLVYKTRLVYESASPAGVGSVIFTRIEGHAESVNAMLVRDTVDYSGSKPIQLVEWLEPNGTPIWPQKAVWSGDGTVVAVTEGGSWRIAYDFRAHRVTDILGLPEKERKSPNAIDKLLQGRGGEGANLFAEPDAARNGARHLWWWEFPEQYLKY